MMNASAMTNPPKRFRHPGLVIAIIGCVLLAIGILTKHFSGSRSQLPQPPQLASPKEASSTARVRQPGSPRMRNASPAL